MGRLDSYLVEKNMIPTRSRAKRAILAGLVQVNGITIDKPSYSVRSLDKVEVANQFAQKCAGYWKLHIILNTLDFDILLPSDIVLDLGSSAGGFLEYAAERCQRVIGVEIAPQFLPALQTLEQKYSNISIHIADIFQITPREFMELFQFDHIDVLLNDLTIDPEASLEILRKVLPLLKLNGYIIMSFKMGPRSYDTISELGRRTLQELNLILIKSLVIDQEKREFHIIAQKKA